MCTSTLSHTVTSFRLHQPAASINIQGAVSRRCGTDKPSCHASPFQPSCHPSWTGIAISRRGSSDGGWWWWAMGEDGGGLSVCLSEENIRPFAPRVRGEYWCSRLQLPAQMPVAPKIKCIKAGSRRLLSDHHDNRRMAWGDDTSTPILPRPREAALQDCFFLRRLSLPVVYVLSPFILLFFSDMSPGSSLS